MYTKIKSLLLIVLALQFSFSQEKDETLLTVDGDEIKASEFIRVYSKNLDLVRDENQKNVDGYLKLFTEYQLKLKEARRLKLDENPNYIREFQKYKNQLTKKYLAENKVTDVLVKEAYERMKLDVKASHILVRLEGDSKDTTAVYNQVLELRDRVLKEGFTKVKNLTHNGTSIFLEDLGYFSAFKMLYDFETMAYNTPVGEFSMPFRTKYGYHVVKVHDRQPTKGYITLAHIMIKHNKKDEASSEKRVNEIYKKLEQGESFESLVKQFSEDKSSIKTKGQFSPFRRGQLNSEEFESTAFALKNNGDYSKPVKTAYGWHIIKRIKLEPVKAFDEMKPEIERLVKKDPRSQLIDNSIVDNLKKKYTIFFNPNAKKYFSSILKDFSKKRWLEPKDFKSEEVLFSINNTKYKYADFSKYLERVWYSYSGNRSLLSIEQIVDSQIDAFFKASILKYREENLEYENKEFGDIIKEYRDGLLLFDLMEQEIWNKALKDSLGLEAFYKDNISNYSWNKRVDITMGSSIDAAYVKIARKMLKKNANTSDIINEVNTEKKQNLIFTKGVFTLKDSKLPHNLKVKKGVSKVYKHNDAYHTILINEIIAPSPKTFKEAKGSVIRDYQNQIEMKWLETLKKRYKVNLNQEVLESIKQQLKN